MSESAIRDFLAGSGEVGRDLLAVDWERTAVGPPESWPPALRQVVRTMLSSRFAMWLGWGEELTFFCNAAYRRDTLGSKYPWALGRPAREVWPEVWPAVSARAEQVMRTGESTWDDALQLFLERSGYPEETYHTFSYSPVIDDDGVVAGMLCVVAEVTDQVVAERRMATLRHLGIRVSTAESAAAAVRAGCEHLASNPASLPFVAAYLFDERRDAVLAGTAGIAPGHDAAPLWLRADDPHPVWPLQRLADGEEVVVDGVDARFADLPTGAWEVPPEKAVLVPIPRPLHQTPYGFLVFGANRHRPVDASFHDFVELIAAHFAAAITDARAMEQERERSDALARLDQAKSDFLANVSHELRTPLTLLLGPTEDALEDDRHPLPGPHRQRLEVVARAGSRMLHLIDTLLDFSRVESGRLEARFQPTDLAANTRDLVGMFAGVADQARLALRFESTLTEPVYVDPEQWTRIVLNLISNAVKYTFHGAVAVRLRRDGDHAVLEVADTGTGIPEAELPRLFERFHRVAGAVTRSVEGAGIGLALVAELVALHGGEVHVDSTPDEGSTFTVRLPLGHEHLPAEQVVDVPDEPASRVHSRVVRSVVAEMQDWVDAGREEPVLPSVVGAGAATVLVVDDNPDMRGYLRGLLAGLYRVLTARDGLEALERLSEESVDLVLTDVMMPRLDGFGLLRRMKEDPLLASVPVVMLSARAGEGGTVAGLEAGADDYLVKPFSARELLARVRVNLELERVQAVRSGLERSQALLDQAQRLAGVGSWEVDMDRGTVTASPTFLELLELSEEELAARGPEGLVRTLLDPTEEALVRGEIQQAHDGDLLSYETRVRLPSGRERDFAVRAEIVTSTGGTRLLRATFQDVTDQRTLQREVVAATAEREAADRERAIADELQRSLLPNADVESETLEVAAFYRAGVAGTQVGGDWYDVLDLGGGRTSLVIGDVMGRGVRAASVMGQMKAAVRAFSRLDLSPVEVLEHLDSLVGDLPGDEIVTCVYAVFDPVEGTLSYANAGHLPPIVVRPDGAAQRLDVLGPPLGAGYFGAETQTVPLPPGSLVTLYTDGVVEQRGVDIDGRLELLESLLVAERRSPVDQLPKLIVDTLVNGEGVADDDIALAIMRVKEPRAELFWSRYGDELTAPARARIVAREVLVEWGVSEADIDDVVLIVSELVTNALRHARPPIDLRLQHADREVVVEVGDRTARRPRRQWADDSDEGGRGLNIVGLLADRWGTRLTTTGKAVWAARRVERE